MKEEFKTLGLSTSVLKSIERLGYQSPSKIQIEMIPFIMDGYDVIGQAQTGTGKTLAYAASMLSKLTKGTKQVQALILTPTRELALQVKEEFDQLNRNGSLDVLAVYGGSNIDQQIKKLKSGVDIVVGTPGRVMDLMKRDVLKIHDLEFFVLDEADEMLNMGFLEDIEFIFKRTNEEKQVLLLSATMPKSILKLAKVYMKKDYQSIAIEEETKTSTMVRQFYYLVSERIRFEALCRVLDYRNYDRIILFCQTKKECDRLLNDLTTRQYSAEVMHGDIAQSVRIQTLERFKKGAFKILIATDVAARGIHVDHIQCVINYNLPQDLESYVHRIGRTGRASHKGEAISFVTQKELRFLKEVERFASCKITECSIPTADEVLSEKYVHVLEKAYETLDQQDGLDDALTYVRDLNKGDLMYLAASLLETVVREELGCDLKKDLTVKVRTDRKVQRGTTRVFLTIGKADKVKKGMLLDFLNEKTGISKSSFHNVEVLKNFTFIDVDSNYVDRVMNVIHRQKFHNREIRIEKAKRKASKN